MLAELRELGHRNRVMTIDDRARLLRHAHAAGRAAQGAREPGLVHGLHAVPARDLAGPAGGAPQLPDDGLRPHRAAARERLAARRGDRRRRGDGGRPARVEGRGRTASSSTPTSSRRRSRRSRTRAEPLGIEIVVADLADGLPDGGCFGVLAQYPGAGGRVRDLDAADRGARTTAGRARRAWPPTCSRSSCSSRRARWAPTSSSARPSASASRSASAARTPPTWRAQRARALAAGPPGRRLGRRRRRPGAAARAADARAAHPPREGDLEHLHRAGAAGRDGLDVRRLPRPRGPRADRAARPPPDGDPGARACADGGLELVHDAFFDTIRVRVPDHADAVHRRRAPARRSTSCASTPTPSASRATRSPSGRRSSASGRRSASRPTIELLDAETADAIPPRARAQLATSSRTRSSASTAPRRRCCATCARSPAATSRSTAR